MKLTRSLRFRFILLFFLFIILLCGITSYLNLSNTTKTISQLFSRQGILLTEKAAGLTDSETFSVILNTLDEKDPEFLEIQEKLLELKMNSGAKYLYTMAPKGDIKDKTWIFVVDGSDKIGGEDYSPPGEEADVSEYDAAFFKCIDTMETQVGAITQQEGWGWLVSIYVPIKTKDGKILGIAGCDYDVDELHTILTKYLYMEIIMSSVFAVLGIILVLSIFRMIFSPLKKINEILKNIATAEGDLTREIDFTKDNEIGELANYFNLTLSKIKNLIVTIKDKSVVLYSVGNELASSMEQTAMAANQISSVIQNIKSKAINQSASVTQTNASMIQVTENIEKLNLNVAKQTESVSQSSSAIEQMLANIQTVTNTLMRNAGDVKELSTASESGKTSVDAVSNNIREIARESEGLLEINSVMENISSQTNLLSMNAAIEAAHAGEAGKGFAVVAGEIRKLAENSGKQSQTISSVLKTISLSIGKISASIEEVLAKFSAIGEKIQTVSDQEGHILHAMEEQSQGSQQILQAVGNLNELTGKVRDGSTEMMTGSKEVITESENLGVVTQEITNGINDMSRSIEEITSAINHINDISRHNRENIDSLAAELAKFKVE